MLSLLHTFAHTVVEEGLPPRLTLAPKATRPLQVAHIGVPSHSHARERGVAVSRERPCSPSYRVQRDAGEPLRLLCGAAF